MSYSPPLVIFDFYHITPNRSTMGYGRNTEPAADRETSVRDCIPTGGEGGTFVQISECCNKNANRPRMEFAPLAGSVMGTAIQTQPDLRLI